MRTLHNTKKTTHVYRAKRSEKRITGFLNSHRETPEAQRVIALLRIIKQIEKLDETLFPAFRQGDEDGSAFPIFGQRASPYHGLFRLKDPNLEALNKLRDQHFDEINKKLSRYECKPQFGAPGYRGIEVMWEFFESEKTIAAKWELDAIVWLIELVEKRGMDRLRSCRQCQNWFYAMTSHQHYCGESCRKKFASGSDQFKEKRRQYMAAYREDLKHQSAAALVKARKVSKG